VRGFGLAFALYPFYGFCEEDFLDCLAFGCMVFGLLVGIRSLDLFSCLRCALVFFSCFLGPRACF
jgi:hypothetical protein